MSQSVTITSPSLTSPRTPRGSQADLDYLQAQARKWLELTLKTKLDDEQDLSLLLSDGEILMRVAKLVAKCHNVQLQQLEPPAFLAGGPAGPATGQSAGGVVMPEGAEIAENRNFWNSLSSIASFLRVCKRVGLRDVNLFTPPDLLEGKDLRRVYLCMRALSKKAVCEEIPDFDGSSTPSRWRSPAGSVSSTPNRTPGRTPSRTPVSRTPSETPKALSRKNSSEDLSKVQEPDSAGQPPLSLPQQSEIQKKRAEGAAAAAAGIDSLFSAGGTGAMVEAAGDGAVPRMKQAGFSKEEEVPLHATEHVSSTPSAAPPSKTPSVTSCSSSSSSINPSARRASPDSIPTLPPSSGPLTSSLLSEDPPCGGTASEPFPSSNSADAHLVAPPSLPRRVPSSKGSSATAGGSMNSGAGAALPATRADAVPSASGQKQLCAASVVLRSSAPSVVSSRARSTTTTETMSISPSASSSDGSLSCTIPPTIRPRPAAASQDIKSRASSRSRGRHRHSSTRHQQQQSNKGGWQQHLLAVGAAAAAVAVVGSAMIVTANARARDEEEAWVEVEDREWEKKQLRGFERKQVQEQSPAAAAASTAAPGAVIPPSPVSTPAAVSPTVCRPTSRPHLGMGADGNFELDFGDCSKSGSAGGNSPQPLTAGRSRVLFQGGGGDRDAPGGALLSNGRRASTPTRLPRLSDFDVWRLGGNGVPFLPRSRGLSPGRPGPTTSSSGPSQASSASKTPGSSAAKDTAQPGGLGGLLRPILGGGRKDGEQEDKEAPGARSFEKYDKLRMGSSLAGKILAGLPRIDSRKVYEVKPGDTLSGIAKSNGLSVARMASLNPHIPNPNVIYPRDRILLG